GAAGSRGGRDSQVGSRRAARRGGVERPRSGQAHRGAGSAGQCSGALMSLRFLAFALLVTTVGCGYSLVGRGITTDPTIKRIGVPLFKDRTGKLGLDQKVTQKVTEELLRRGRFDVVPQATGVDA